MVTPPHHNSDPIKRRFCATKLDRTLHTHHRTLPS
ncbi:hypothetical protein CIPAW_13G105500 [Carya illinoinensis]|uniref:Uncharacterized protein n=1 Tax=Carya illinoinensis TaxID=32201 RepID=A0A8T1NSG1_CARIL|nr:hypothetical protein CIPAW_13G105500 [Carya illinoinensis]